MLISRNEALDRLREYREVAHVDPESAREMAISVLLDIVNDSHIHFAFQMVTGFREPLKHMLKLQAEDEEKIIAPVPHSEPPAMDGTV